MINSFNFGIGEFLTNLSKLETKKVDGIIASIIAMNEYSHYRTSGSGEEFWGVISL